MKTANITDYRLISPTLAKVIVTTTGNPDAEFIKAELSRKLEGLAIPVANSFKSLTANSSIGFVRANKPVRAVTEKELVTAYKKMSANVMMDKEDQSLWEVKSGATGRYLARHDQEDLTALVASASQRRVDVPQIRQVTIARAAAQELVAFVDADGDMDYGFATATNDKKVRVVSFKRRAPIEASYDDQVVSISQVQIPKETHQQVMAAMTPAEKQNANAYWTKLFSWAPEYLAQIKEDVNKGTVL